VVSEGNNHDPAEDGPFGPVAFMLAVLAILGCPILGTILGWYTFQDGGGMASIPDLFVRIACGGFFGFVAGLVVVGLMYFTQTRK
jgi:hypothetical protein